MLGLTLHSGVALAQSTTAAFAESLFEQGKQLSAEAKYEEACPRFAESYRLDPATGTLLNLGACQESLGKTASAWAAFHDALALARRDQTPERVTYAEDRIKSLEARLIRLQINVPAESNLPGLVVKLDGTVLSSAAFGIPNPIDPGHHTVDLSAPGKKSAHFVIEAVTPKATLQATVPTLSDEPGSAPAIAAPPAPAAPALEPNAAPAGVAAPPNPLPAPAPQAAPGVSPVRVAGYVVGGAGLVGLGVGALFHLQATKQNDRALSTCSGGPAGNQCASEADFSNHNGFVNTAKSDRTMSYVAFGAGAATLVTGIVLIVAGHPNERPNVGALWPVVERDRVGCSFSGAF